MLKWCGRPAADTEVGPRCGQHSPPPTGGHPHGQRIRAIINSDKLTLSREERHDLARMLVNHSGSWKTLGEPEARRIADALDSFLIIQALLLLRSQQ